MKKNGFTLIEIIAVIIIIGILALIAVPAITQYISGSQKNAYSSHENNMKSAAKNMTVDCLKNNSQNCNLPDKGHKNLIYLGDIIEGGYLTELKDPKGSGMCSNTLSYVEIENTGNSNYEYTACLYCGEYKTDDTSCVKYAADGDMPKCGDTVIGESTKWTNKDRTITVTCSDETSGCTKNEFSKVFKETTTIGNVEIVDQTGNITNCPVNAYVDKAKPTCSLEIVGGTLETTGWYSGDVKVKLKETNDVGSGVLTYGIGTSIENRNYNKGTEIELKTGYTTVMGYVKDIAGNEGICSIDIRVGISKPEFNIEYGYQIYPNKESYDLINMTETGTTLTSTSTDPQISFSGLNNYKNVSKVIIHLNSGVPTTTTGQIFYSNAGYTPENSKNFVMPQGATKLEAEIPKGTYSNIRVDLGTLNGKAYNIKKIELIVGDRSSLYTNKDVTINLIPYNDVIKTTHYSFDGGATWQTSNSKAYAGNYSGKAQTKNSAPLTSLTKDISITNIDKLQPNCSLEGVGEKNANGGFVNGATVQFLTKTDSAANSQNAMSGVKKYGIGSINGSATAKLLASDPEKTFIGYIEDNAGNKNECKITLIGDSTPPSVTYSVAGGTYNEPKSVVITPSDNQKVKSYSVYVYKDNALLNKYENLTTTSQTIALNQNGVYEIRTMVVDTANNKITKTPQKDGMYYQTYTMNLTYSITYNLNGGTATNPTTYNINTATFTLNNPTRTGYTFTGWTGSNGTTPSMSVTITKGTTGDKTYSATWQTSTYTVNYNCNGGSGSTASSTHMYGVAQPLSISNCTKPMVTGSGTGTNGTPNVYVFVGWSTSSTATTPTYTDGQRVTNITQNSSITLYAVWSKLFTYSGSYTLEKYGNDGWKIKFLGSGTFKSLISVDADLFAVGGGGGGYLGGGGGGYTKTALAQKISAGTYTVTVGAGGGVRTNGGTSSFGSLVTANGGKGGNTGDSSGGDGGSGGGGDCGQGWWGHGGTNGGDGAMSYAHGWMGDHYENYPNFNNGKGQGTTTKEFGESNGTLYSGGGGGGASSDWKYPLAQGASPGSSRANRGDETAGYGSGSSARGATSSATSGVTNRGGGGGGAHIGTAGTGGSGIVIMRGKFPSSKTCGSVTYTYSGNASCEQDSSGNWKISFLTSGNFVSTSSLSNVQVFLVGGGGAGKYSGGGGGYTKTTTTSITANTTYFVKVGNGGLASSNTTTGDGESSSFGSTITVAGGKAGTSSKGGDGGSGGGGHCGQGWWGHGGTNGGDGYMSYAHGWMGDHYENYPGFNQGKGQGTTTREFGESTGALYSGGGGGGASSEWKYPLAQGSSPGSTRANRGDATAGYGSGSSDRGASSGPTAGITNTGGGGGGGAEGTIGGDGGSGIVIIRNKR